MTKMKRPTFLFVSMALAVLLACTAAVLTAVPVVGQTTTVALVAAEDIASCNYDRDQATADVLAGVSGTVFTLGDNVYPTGTAAQFRDCYHPTWGAQKSRTKPSVGNHEYYTADASGYFGYFGARAGDPSRGYYTYKKGSWLKQTLNNYPAKCTMAYFHHPLFASTGATSPEVRPFWNILYNHNADVILSGHAHYYERFARQRPDGTRDRSRGIRE